MSSTLGPFHAPESYVLDSWPFLELMVRAVPILRLSELFMRAAKVEVVLAMSEMNLGEIFYRLSREKGEAEAQETIERIASLPMTIVPISSGDVLRAARIKARTTISYADCFCAGLAIERDAAVVTGDHDFLELEHAGLLRVDWVGA